MAKPTKLFGIRQKEALLVQTSGPTGIQTSQLLDWVATRRHCHCQASYEVITTSLVCTIPLRYIFYLSLLPVAHALGGKRVLLDSFCGEGARLYLFNTIAMRGYPPHPWQGVERVQNHESVAPSPFSLPAQITVTWGRAQFHQSPSPPGYLP